MRFRFQKEFKHVKEHIRSVSDFFVIFVIYEEARSIAYANYEMAEDHSFLID